MSQLSINISFSRPGFNFSFNETFAPGITGIFGHSGAGKTTLMQCISGIIKPNSGTIISNTINVFSSEHKINVPINKRHIGYVFQEGRLFPHYTIKKNLLYGTRFLKNRKNKIDLGGVIKMFELNDLLDKYPSELSGGERQRVALGRALLAAPEALLLDEPFSALDQKLRQQIIPFIAKITKQLNIPVLIVSHDLPDILKLTDRICILENGIVLAHKCFSELYNQDNILHLLPAQEFVNTVTLEVKNIDIDKGIITLNGMGAESKVNILLEPKRQKYQQGEKVKVFIRPDSIVLAPEKLLRSSFQNQLKGKVTRIINEGARTLCVIDCGFPLMAEVSKAAKNELKLTKGDEIYCLFKSLSLDTIQL